MNITVNDLKNNLFYGIIIDIRSIQKYNNNHLPNAINIPYSKLILEYNNLLNKNTKYLIYCEKSITSPKLVKFLCKQGYDCYNLVGGYEEWVLKQ